MGDGSNGRTISEDGYTVTGSRYSARGVTLYGNGEAVAMSSSEGSRTMYLGKDVMGSVRSVTVDTGTLEDRYEYDAFGQPYKGDLGKGMNLGYTGKPYDTATGLYNYGCRDYKPQTARFTTVDPVRDGSNWFAYVNNDPVNWVDRWGLEAFRNGETQVTVQGNFPDSGTGYTITITNGPNYETGDVPNHKINVITAIDSNTGTMPPFDKTTTITYEKDGKAQEPQTSTIPDPTEGKGLPSPATVINTAIGSDGFPINIPMSTVGSIDSISLPPGVAISDVTKIEVTLTRIDTSETVTETVDFSPPSTPSDKQNGGRCND